MLAPASRGFVSEKLSEKEGEEVLQVPEQLSSHERDYSGANSSLQPVEIAVLKQFLKDFSTWKGLRLEEGTAERAGYRLTTIPHSLAPLCQFRGGGRR